GLEEGNHFAKVLVLKDSKAKREHFHMEVTLREGDVNIWTVIGTATASIATAFLLPIVAESVDVFDVEFYEGDRLVSRSEYGFSSSVTAGIIPGFMYLYKGEPGEYRIRAGKSAGLKIAGTARLIFGGGESPQAVPSRSK